MATRKTTRKPKTIAEQGAQIVDESAETAEKATEAMDEIEKIAETAKPSEFKAKKVVCEGYRGLNVREKPRKTADVLRVVAPNTTVMAKEAVDGWCELESGGYVMAKYLA